MAEVIKELLNIIVYSERIYKSVKRIFEILDIDLDDQDIGL